SEGPRRGPDGGHRPHVAAPGPVQRRANPPAPADRRRHLGRGHRLHVVALPRPPGEGEAVAERLPLRGDPGEAAVDGGRPPDGGAPRDPGPRAQTSCPDAGGGPMNPRAIVEAALFSAGKALTPEELAQTTRLEPDVIRTHLRALAHEYTERESAIEVAQIGTKWTMQIRSEFAERARGFAPPEIDRDLLKTAALIAYHQPLLQSDLFDMIGSKVYEHTKGLEDLGLINRKPSGRSLALTTTRYFAEFFGLKSTDREGIRRLMAQKAGVPHKERPEEPPDDASEAPAGPDELPPPESNEASRQDGPHPAGRGGGPPRRPGQERPGAARRRERHGGREGPRRGRRGDGREGLQGRGREGERGPRTREAELPGPRAGDRRLERKPGTPREGRRGRSRRDGVDAREGGRGPRRRRPRGRHRLGQEGLETEREDPPRAPLLLLLQCASAHRVREEPEPQR